MHGAPVSTACERLVVLKVGGSVLTGPASYRRVARAIGAQLHDDPGARLVVVVSAQHGMTDDLLATARDIAGEPEPAALDLLWSTGELRSAALLTLALHAAGISAAAANVHQSGLVTSEAGRVTVRPLRLRALAARYDVVVVPGFLARDAGDVVVSLGRGGSDLTAVLLATGLRAERCDLIKDVPGYFSSDPNVEPAARHLPALTYADAIAMSRDGCALVQHQALEGARDAGLRLVVRAFDDPRTSEVS